MADLAKETRFSAFLAARNNETTVRWQKVQIFLLINSFLLGATINASVTAALKLGVCIFGVIMCVIWGMMLWEAQNAIDYWNGELAKMEPSEEGIQGFGFKEPRRGFRFAFVSTHHLIVMIVTLFTMGWMGLMTFYVLA